MEIESIDTFVNVKYDMMDKKYYAAVDWDMYIYKAWLFDRIKVKNIKMMKTIR